MPRVSVLASLLARALDLLLLSFAKTRPAGVSSPHRLQGMTCLPMLVVNSADVI